jgi:DNA primase
MPKSKYRSKGSMYLVSDFAKDYFHQLYIKKKKAKQLVFHCYFKNAVYSETIEKFSLGLT